MSLLRSLSRPSLRCPSLPRALWLFAACGSTAFVACGSPQGLDESLFPDAYQGVSSAGTLGGGQGGTGSVAAGNGGTGSSNGGRGGSQSVANPGGSGGQAGSSSNLGGNGGRAQTATGGTGSGAGMGGTGQVGGACPSDITVLFNRPPAQGGCAGAACHQPNGFPPDLISPNPEMRLLNRPSSCQGVPFIGADESYLVEKVTDPRSGCGEQMPFMNAAALSAADRACIVQWVEDVGGGG
jgi:hypothetical protein